MDLTAINRHPIFEGACTARVSVAGKEIKNTTSTQLLNQKEIKLK